MKVTLKRGSKGEMYYEAYVRADTVEEATRQLEDVDAWFKRRFAAASYRG